MTLRDDRLAYIDQASFLSLRAIGRHQLAQLVWIYEHPLDFDGLKRFHANLGAGLIGRLIETSALPFGRHRWVTVPGPQSDIEVVEPARARDHLNTWLDEQAQAPIDPEHGPGWRLAVLPMTDGSSAVSLVTSHSLTDGLGLILHVAAAAKGEVREIGHAPPASRTRRQSLAADARQTVRDLPELGRTLVAAAKLFYRRRNDFSNAGASRGAVSEVGNPNENVVVPTAALFVGVEDWDARANALGGNSYSLVAGFASRLAERMGRQRADGAVSLLVALSERAEDDTRANAVSIANVVVDPAPVHSDLSGVRAAMKQGLQTAKDVPDETFALLPLTPFVPKRAVKRTADVMFGDLPVSCSNLGQLDPAVGQADGTDAEYFIMRAVDQKVTRSEIERVGGQLVVVAGRIGGKVTMGLVGYQNGGTNTSAHLRELAVQTLAEFGLEGSAI